MLIMAACTCTQKVEETRYQSVNYGRHCATDGQYIFYNHADGIYKVNMDMSDTELFVKARGVSLVSVDGEYLAYSLNDKKKAGTTAYSQIIRIVPLAEPNNVLSEYNMDTCHYIYLQDNKLYLYGVMEQLKRTRANGDAEWGIYFCDIAQDEELQLVTDNMCSRPSKLYDLMIYEDDNICWFYDYNKNISEQHNALYSKPQKQLITHFWGNKNYLKSTNEGVLLLEDHKLCMLSQSNKQILVEFPEPSADVQGNSSVFSGWMELSDNHYIFIAERYSFRNSTLGKPTLNDHLYDILYLVDGNYSLIDKFWTDQGEKIIYANDQYIIMMKENELFVTYYSSLERREKLGVVEQMYGTFSVEVCGGNLLFFQNNEMKQFVNISHIETVL